jgi:hypothetical protein
MAHRELFVRLMHKNIPGEGTIVEVRGLCGRRVEVSFKLLRNETVNFLFGCWERPISRIHAFKRGAKRNLSQDGLNRPVKVPTGSRFFTLTDMVRLQGG